MQKLNVTRMVNKSFAEASLPLPSPAIVYEERTVTSTDGLSQLRANLAQLEDIQNRFAFLMRELAGVIKTVR